jgi:DNA-binding CsgD family transcriptional regulator
VHDHICHICYNGTESREIGAKFIAHGIKNQERSVVIKSTQVHTEFYDRLLDNGISINRARSNCLLIELILKDAGTQDINSLLHTLENLIQPKISAGYKPVRILYIEDGGDNESLLLKESRIDEFCTKNMVVIMHQYETKYLNSEGVIDLFKTHEHIVIENALYKSPIFLNRDEVLKNILNETPHTNFLTNKEKIILKYLAEGYTNKRVSRELGISIRTVEAHRNNIMKKLNARTIVDVVRYALRHKIIK